MLFENNVPKVFKAKVRETFGVAYFSWNFQPLKAHLCFFVDCLSGKIHDNLNQLPISTTLIISLRLSFFFFIQC